MIVGVPKEIADGERRVALVPDALKSLAGLGLEVAIERGAGEAAGYPDAQYEAAGAQLVGDAEALYGMAQLLLKVQPPRPREGGRHEIELLREGSALVSLLRPFDEPKLCEGLAQRRVNAFALELMPRITRAQAMDVLSSQSTIAGYRAVMLAALALPRIFPMLVTAAGTLKPAKCFVLGAGVAGLQALATAKRLGAVTSAYDTRAAVREQVSSIGAKFVELDLDLSEAEDAGGYARAQSDALYREQRRQLARHVAAADVVISTALVPGRPAPLLIEEQAVEAMQPGSVIVDLAAEKGGNCACTEADREVVRHGVTVIGYTNLPAQVPAHASQMYAKNLTTFLAEILDEGELKLDRDNEIIAGTLVTTDGEVVHEALRSRLGGDVDAQSEE